MTIQLLNTAQDHRERTAKQNGAAGAVPAAGCGQSLAVHSGKRLAGNAAAAGRPATSGGCCVHILTNVTNVIRERCIAPGYGVPPNLPVQYRVAGTAAECECGVRAPPARPATAAAG
jgi:hypothetical protein